MMINTISTALSGLNLASKRMDESANNIANATTPGIGENVNLAEEIVNLKLGEIQYKANITTLKAAGELSDELFRIFDKEV